MLQQCTVYCCCASVCTMNSLCTVDCMFQFLLLGVWCYICCHFWQRQLTVVWRGVILHCKAWAWCIMSWTAFPIELLHSAVFFHCKGSSIKDVSKKYAVFTPLSSFVHIWHNHHPSSPPPIYHADIRSSLVLKQCYLSDFMQIKLSAMVNSSIAASASASETRYNFCGLFSARRQQWLDTLHSC